MLDLAGFFERYDIRAIGISKDADIRDAEASLVTIHFDPDPQNGASKYQVTFKLLAEAAGTHRHVRDIGTPPKCPLDLTGIGAKLGQHELDEVVKGLLRAIEKRVAKIHKEQSILNVQPVGKTFTLFGKTRFEVLADDGQGRLTIRLLRAEGASEASLAANDLLDGLYSGQIQQD